MTPLELQAAIARLWAKKYRTEPAALSSEEFAAVCDLCRALYCKPGTPYHVDKDFDFAQLRTEVRNVFRHAGAPWFEGIAPTPEVASTAIEGAYQRSEQRVTHLVPLDIADDLPATSFGPFEARQYSKAEFSGLVSLAKLARFGPPYVLDVEKLSQFTWLVFREQQPRHKVWRSDTFLDGTNWDEIGRVRQLKRRFSPELELGLFVLTLPAWEDVTVNNYWTWQPFRFPWVYAVSDDPLREPQRAPDPASLTWENRIDANTEELYSVPQQNVLDDVNKLNLPEYLSHLWPKAQSVLGKARVEQGCFNPLIEHYFLRAFEEEGLDQLLWHAAAVDAAVGKNEGSGSTDKLCQRVRKLTDDHVLTGKFAELYDRRSEYIHGRKVKDKNLWQTNLATARKAARIVVNEVLELAHQYPDWTRDDLLNYLDK
jgi:hypothetical protein